MQNKFTLNRQSMSRLKCSWPFMRSITGSQAILLSSVKWPRAGRLVSLSGISCLKSQLHKHIKVWKWEFQHEFMNINQVVRCVQCSIKPGVAVPVTSKVKISWAQSRYLSGNVSRSWCAHVPCIMGRERAPCDDTVEVIITRRYPIVFGINFTWNILEISDLSYLLLWRIMRVCGSADC